MVVGLNLSFPLINNPAEPKIFCLGNDPTKADALAPIMSLYADRVNKIINVQGRMKCPTNYDEFASSLDSLNTQAQISLLRRQFEIENMPYLQILHAKMDTFEIGHPFRITYTLANLGNYPVKITAYKLMAVASNVPPTDEQIKLQDQEINRYGINIS